MTLRDSRPAHLLTEHCQSAALIEKNNATWKSALGRLPITWLNSSHHVTIRKDNGLNTQEADDAAQDRSWWREITPAILSYAYSDDDDDEEEEEEEEDDDEFHNICFVQVVKP